MRGTRCCPYTSLVIPLQRRAWDSNPQVLADNGFQDRPVTNYRSPPPNSLARTQLSNIRSFSTAEASEDLLEQIRTLVFEAFDGTFSDEDWDHSLGGQHFIVIEDDTVLSHAAVVERTIEVAGRRFRTGYLEGVATTAARQGEGLGSIAVAEATRSVSKGFEMGALSTGRQGFYARLGWERWAGPSFVRKGAEDIRTEGDDDGLMILRFGLSESIDLAAPISCEFRSGDVW